MEKFIPGTGITETHLKKVRALSDKYKVPIYVMGSRARHDATVKKEIAGHDLDLAFIIDNPVHEKQVFKRYEEMSRDARNIENVEHNPMTVHLKRIPELFRDDLERYSGYIVIPGSKEMAPYLKQKKEKENNMAA